MSGALVALGNVVNRVTSVGNAASAVVRAVSSATSAVFGGASGENIISLGDVDFTGFEVPEKVTVGGQQQMTVHKLTGGERVIDVMGRDDRALEWSGYLKGPDAVTRAQQLDAMRVAGQENQLFWATYNYTVVIASFECDYGVGGFMMPYRISCTVLRDEAQQAPDDDAVAPSVSGGISGAIDQVQSGIASVQSAISTATAIGSKVLGAVGQVTGALGISSPFLATASAGLAQAQGLSYSLGQVSSGITQIQGVADSLGSVSSTLGAGRDAVGEAFSSLNVTDASSVLQAVTNAGAAAVMSAARS